MSMITIPKLAQYAKSTAVAVYFMTAVKATVRPAFNLADKKSDENARKFSAVNEFLYQIVCIGMAALLIPAFERGGFKLAKKQLAKTDAFKNIKKLGNVETFGDLKKLYKDLSFDKKHVEKVGEIKDAINKKIELTAKQKEFKKANDDLNFVHGGIETGSFIASILGLTIIAPKLGHEILHPILEKLGMSHDKPKDDIGTPQELHLADRKVPEDKTSKIDTKA